MCNVYLAMQFTVENSRLNCLFLVWVCNLVTNDKGRTQAGGVRKELKLMTAAKNQEDIKDWRLLRIKKLRVLYSLPNMFSDDHVNDKEMRKIYGRHWRKEYLCGSFWWYVVDRQACQE